MTLALDLNAGAVLAAAFANVLAGVGWYSRWVFGPEWQLLVRKTEEEVAAARPRALAVSALAALAGALVTAVFADRLGVFGFLEGARLGVLGWAGFAATAAVSDHVFSDRPPRLFVINQGCHLARFVLMGAIVGVWR